MAGRPLGGWQVSNLSAPFPSQRPHPIMQCQGAALAPCMTRPFLQWGRHGHASAQWQRRGRARTGPLGAWLDSRPGLWCCGGRKACRWRCVHVCGHRWQRVTTGSLGFPVICPKQPPCVLALALRAQLL